MDKRNSEQTTKDKTKPEAEPAEWRYLEHGKGFWKHVYNADNANRLYDENEKLPESRRHFIEPLYPLSAITALQEQVDRLTRERDADRDTMVPLSVIHPDGTQYAFIDGTGDVELDHGGKLRSRAEAAEARATSLERELADVRQALIGDLNVTNEELLRIRNDASTASDAMTKIWGKMLLQLIDSIRQARALLSNEEAAKPDSCKHEWVYTNYGASCTKCGVYNDD